MMIHAPNDTSQDAENLQIQLLSALSPAERVAKVWHLSATVRGLALAAIKRANPAFSLREVQARFIELHYSLDLSRGFLAHTSDSHDP